MCTRSESERYNLYTQQHGHGLVRLVMENHSCESLDVSKPLNHNLGGLYVEYDL